MTDNLHLTVIDRVAYITVDRPQKRNAMSTAMWRALIEYVHQLTDAHDVCAVVLRGSSGSFCAGGDLSEIRGDDAEAARAYRQLAENAVIAFGRLAQPTFAEIDGPCLGAGCSLALACDIRIAAPTAQFAIPSLRNGLTYEAPFVRRLTDTIGSGPSGLLLLAGERWNGTEAAAYGLVDRCTDDPSSTIERAVDYLRGASHATVAETILAIRGTHRTQTATT
ncbi:UNVERIFIED_ORG: enoyl-CoA hydratase/carnithine racemase [Gordonia westfalica J30]